ncbi:hypothetical protein C6P42_003485 [Pichia californica]|nr:hypothetical protein C6P42_003485 [[Candida] californica]
MPYFSSLSPSFDFSNLISPIYQDQNQNIGPYNSIQATTSTLSTIPPLSLNGEENPTSFIDLFSNGFPKLLQDHFKMENTFNNLENSNDNNNSNNITDQFKQIKDTFKFSPRFQTNNISEQSTSQNSKNNYNDTILNSNNNGYSKVMFNNNNNVNKINHNMNMNNITNNISDLNNNNSNDDSNNNNFSEKITALIKSNQPLHLYTNPSIVLNSTLANLSPMGQKMYEYYRDKLSYVVCSAPKTENMYLKTFLPMAHIDKSVLYGIMAWSAFHLGMEKQGNYYIKLALQGFFKRPILNEEIKGNIQLICDEVDDNDDEIVKEIDENDDVELYQDLELSKLNRDNMINMRLASFLILCGVEICKGDVSKWSKYLTYGAKLIKLKGGLERFNESKDEHFLVTNYAYHDITAIQVINERTIHFDLKEYEKMWRKSNELGFSDPLHGISSPVFKILAEINKLVIIVQKLIKRTMKDENDNDNNNNKNNKSDNTNDNNLHSSKNISDSPEGERFYGLEEEDYWINGDIDKSSIGSSSIDEVFMNGIPSTVSDEWIDNDFDKEVVLEDFDQVMLECQNIEQRVVLVKPKIAPGVSNKDLELQLTIFECFQITAKIHLRQSVLRMNSASIEIQYLTTQLIKLLDVLLGSDVEACLCLPMFIAGMNSVRKKDRFDMMKRFESFINRYKWKNVSRCQIVIRYIWKLNCKGEKFVDWYAVVKTLGWDLSFA